MSSSYAPSHSARRNSQPEISNHYDLEDNEPLSQSTGFLETQSNFSQDHLAYNSNAGSSISAAGSSAQANPGHLPDQQNYAEKCRCILGLVISTTSLLEDLRETNSNLFVVQYPFIGINDPQRPKRSQSFSKINDMRRKPKRAHTLSANLNSLEPISEFQQEVYHRLLTPEDSQHFNTQLSVLKLDMKLQDHSSAEILSLEKSSIAQLLNSRITKILKHLQSLSARISDKSSKVLVAGDLNAGKSTFVNALLRRAVLPVDQQPCTSLFCEVLDARENGGVEAVHGIKDIQAYNVDDPSTYTDVGFQNLEKVVSDNPDGFTLLKIYCQDRRLSNESLLHNGVVDIALIDCPGLNSDSLKTMAVFARQEEIDVIVFVVSAENHFTLSANQFLWNASNEKAYLFIVVNKFEQIKNKEKCRRAILDQIKQLSPRTYEYHDDLVHFVSANAINIDRDPPSNDKIPEVDHLEESLRTFVLKKRSQSKLAPAEHYLRNLLFDVGVLSEFNRDIAEKEYEQVTKELEEGEPTFKKLQRDGKRVVEDAERAAEATCCSIQQYTKIRLDEVILNVHDAVEQCTYPGLFSVWNYAMELRDIMLETIQKEVLDSEFSAKEQTVACITTLQSMKAGDSNQDLKQVDIDKLFACKGRNIQIHIDPSDFFDFDLEFNMGARMHEGLGMIGLSSGALVMFGGKFMGYNHVMSALWKFTNVIGLNNMRKLALPLFAVAGIGLTVYIIKDAPKAASRKIARKIQNQLALTNFSDQEANRVAKKARKATRSSINLLRDCFRRAIEAEEQKREEQRARAKLSNDAKFYFGRVLSKAEEMSKVLEAMAMVVEEYEVSTIN